jgi:excisionase family DNA binding protein
MDKLITPEELAEITSLNVRTIVRLAKDGTIPAVKFSGRWRFVKEDIEDYIKNQARHRRHRILVADDNDKILKMMRGIINDMGHEPLLASNGDEALSVLKREDDISLIVLDLLMPGKTGVDIFEYLKEQDLKVPVVIFSGHLDHELFEKALRYQFMTVLKKPAKSDEIRGCLEVMLSGSGSWGEESA